MEVIELVKSEIRRYIEENISLEELNVLVCSNVFKDEVFDKNYSTDIKDCEKIIDKYSDSIIINTIKNDFSKDGWHCNIRGIHSFGNKTMMEAICKASLIYELNIWTESEEYQNQLEKLDIGSEKFVMLQKLILDIEDDKHKKS